MSRRPPFAEWLSQTNDVTRTFLAAGGMADVINLGGGLPEPSTYPAADLARLAHQAVEEHPEDSLNYAPIEGMTALRDLIAKRFSKGPLRVGRGNVLITTGGMQALDLLGKIFADPDSAIAAQSPTYLGALDAWRPRHPVYRPMRLNANDLDAEAALDGARFAYTVPNFSNPTGELVDVTTRRKLVEAARATGTPLVEDDPYGALFYDGPPLPRMLELDAENEGEGEGDYDGPVIYLGSLSKELAPGLRIGWVIAAPEVIGALVLAKQGTDLATSSLSQRIALDALEDGVIERNLPATLDTYRERRSALCAALEAHLSEWFTWEEPVGGMFVWITAKDPRIDTDRLLSAGLDCGVCISPGSVFDPEGTDRRSVRLNFTANPPEVLEKGVERLARAVRGLIA
ncbi:PLP-dependent aminotransferase family protein [Salipiger mucosus]|uniref:Aspartate aminotransferase (AspB-4) n=1 Tax=Salipiger mucosus DSM 16094 TaxID=1123237 RepID=S9Q8E3_9RHOB|nr:PLP-dependent aminotransferase family protein [Salipiger mucosus]EPX75898.1 Aspartate aminotransferase (AspB-4) [Salipiger mucosus DSM 16094]